MARKDSGTPNLPANIDEQLKQEVAELSARVQAPTGIMIKLGKDKTFRMPDGTSSPGPLNAVIVDFVNRNTYYDTKYNEKNPVPPVCFAINKVLKDMRPSDNSPKKQNETCAGCEQNKFPEEGGPKPCKNTRLLALMMPNAKDDSPILVLAVSPTALKSFDGYVGSVAKMFNKPPIGVITEISFDPSSEFQSLRFGNPKPNGNVVYHMSRRADAQAILNAEPVFTAKGGKPAVGAQRRGKTLR